MEKTKKFPIEIIIGLTDDVFNEAGRLKSRYKIPLGDSIAVAECIRGNGTLITSDHNDIGKVEKAEKIKVFWLRLLQNFSFARATA